MKKAMNPVALLLALALWLAVVPAQAQAGIEGTWQETGEAGRTVLVLGWSGNYLIWRSWEDEIETGIYSLEDPYLVLERYESTTSRWKYSLMDGKLLVKQEDTGISQTFESVFLPVPEDLLGEWEGEDYYGDVDLAFRANGEFEEISFADGSYYLGNFIADEEAVAVSYEDGYPLFMTYIITYSGTDQCLDLFGKESGDLIYSMWRATGEEPEPSRDLTEQPATDPPAATPATEPVPLVTVSPEPAVTVPPAASPGLTGAWRGKDDKGERMITFLQEGRIRASFTDPANAAPEKNGTFTVTGDRILVSWEDGTAEIFRFLLFGGNLLLADEGLKNPVNYTRRPEEESLDPALMGTWGGVADIGYFEYTFTPDGAVTLLVLPDESRSLSGTATAREGIMEFSDGSETSEVRYSIQGDTLMMDDKIQARRMPGPLARGPFPDTTPSASGDPSLVGVWGGMQEGA